MLRCDAGLSVAQASEAINASRVPLSNAESGRRRLQDAYVGPLSRAYGVTTEELLTAQDVSFGLRRVRPLRKLVRLHLARSARRSTIFWSTGT